MDKFITVLISLLGILTAILTLAKVIVDFKSALIASKSKAAQEPDTVRPRDNPKQERIKFPLRWTLLSLLFILFLLWCLMPVLSKTTPATPSDVFLLALYSLGILFYILTLMCHLAWWDIRRKK